MIDRPVGNFGNMPRAPDLRLGDIRTEIIRRPAPFEHRVEDQGRSVFVYLLRGNLMLELEGLDQPPIAVSQGTAAGFESGRAHWWRATSSQSAGLRANRNIELFLSSIPRKMGVLQQMENGMILVPPKAEPFAKAFRDSVAIHVNEVENPQVDSDAVIRRAAEIGMIQFVRYARSKLTAQPNLPAGLRHDEALLRAWTAYFSEPQRRWTVKALADAAALGRTTFLQRFRDVFGASPLQTLTVLRLEQAEAMLRNTRAPLIEIAFTVGYNSEAAFVRAFHRHYGSPPGRFRRRYHPPVD